MTPHPTQKRPGDPVSKCCSAPLSVSHGEEGTSCWICTACQKPTDPSPESAAEMEKFLSEYERELETNKRTGSIPKWNFWLRGCQDACRLIRSLQSQLHAQQEEAERLRGALVEIKENSQSCMSCIASEISERALSSYPKNIPHPNAPQEDA